MENTKSNFKSQLYAAGLGALGGAILLAFATRAIPKMFSKMMGGMMQNMMAEMAAEGCDPSEI
jgi:CheY-specific phosphatase CheX